MHHIRDNNYNYNNAVNFAIQLQNTLSQLNLPPHCTLVPRNQNMERCVIIDFVHPHSDHTGHVMLMKPDGNDENGFKVLCSIDSYNGYFIDMTVNSLVEALGVIAFCQNLLQYQPEQDQLDFVRVPNHLLNHWCVPVHLRERNLENIGNPNGDQNVGY
jgi:hypothetical protein